MKVVLWDASSTVRKVSVAIALFVCTALSAFSMPIDHKLVVTVRTVCNDAGMDCSFQGPAGNLFYETETRLAASCSAWATWAWAAWPSTWTR